MTKQTIYLLISHNDLGGAQKAQLKLAKTLSEKERDVKLICLYSKSEGVPEYESIGGEYDKIKFYHYFLIFYKIFVFYIEKKPKIVISFLPLANLVNGFFGKIFSTKKRVISHRNPIWTYNKLLILIDKIFGSIGMYTHVVGNSKAVAESYSQYGEKYNKISHIINNSVIKIQPKKDYGQLCEEYNIDPNKKILLAVGRLSQQKRFDVIIKAIQGLENVQLIIAGEGELRDRLFSEVLSDMSVNFLGAIPHQEIIDLMYICDLYLQPSEFEGQSNSLLEAISCGAAVISSNIPPQVEVLLDDGVRCGEIVNDFEPTSWNRAIYKVLNSETICHEFTEKALSRSLFFSPEKTADKYIALVAK